jgi:hypothetical protein
MLKRLLICFAMAIGITFAAVAPANAMTAPIPHQATQFAACSAGLANYLGLEPWYSCLQKKYGQVKITNLNDIWLIVLPLLEDFIRAAGYIAVGFIFWGGIKYIKSQGNPGETTQARDVIRNAIIGLVWVLLSVAVIEFVAIGIQTGI